MANKISLKQVAADAGVRYHDARKLLTRIGIEVIGGSDVVTQSIGTFYRRESVKRKRVLRGVTYNVKSNVSVALRGIRVETSVDKNRKFVNPVSVRGLGIGRPNTKNVGTRDVDSIRSLHIGSRMVYQIDVNYSGKVPSGNHAQAVMDRIENESVEVNLSIWAENRNTNERSDNLSFAIESGGETKTAFGRNVEFNFGGLQLTKNGASYRVDVRNEDWGQRIDFFSFDIVAGVVSI